jgi:hypothetical protein
MDIDMHTERPLAFLQIERFACLYTSHVSNLVFYSPFKSYKGRLDTMAHEDEAPYNTQPHNDTEGSTAFGLGVESC